METLSARITHLFLRKHYIEPEQVEWFQYGLTRRMIGCFTFILLLPIGAILSGWIGSFLYLYTFRFLRTRTGGYHSKTPHGCLLSSFFTMLSALMLTKLLNSPLLTGTVMFVSALCILVLAPANNASLHLTADEITAISPRIRLRLAFTILVGFLLLFVCAYLASCISAALLAVSVLLVLANLGFGAQ